MGLASHTHGPLCLAHTPCPAAAISALIYAYETRVHECMEHTHTHAACCALSIMTVSGEVKITVARLATERRLCCMQHQAHSSSYSPASGQSPADGQKKQ